jgi:archaemetzincin
MPITTTTTIPTRPTATGASFVLFVAVAALFFSGCTPREPPGLPLANIEKSLRPIAKPLAAPQPGDWLGVHSEDGQTFAQYLRLKPIRRSKDARTIYLLLLGDFSSEQKQVLEVTQQYLSVFYQTPVTVRRELPLDVIPESGRRVHPSWGTPQVSTAYVLNELLKPDRPDDALAYLCFTSSDLFSGATRNYVLGEAQTWERLGVWSIYRNGDPTESDEVFRQCLRRTMHIATHETGHILALKHCTAFECNMNGANSVSETDRHPLHFCPVCLRKLLWNIDADPDAYLADLQQFCRDQNLTDEASWYVAAQQRLNK